MTEKELDERLFNLFEDEGSSIEDWYSIHTLGETTDFECIHLTDKSRMTVKQLIRDCIATVIPEKGYVSHTKRAMSGDYIEDTFVSRYDIEANTKELLGDKE
jgi:hypothetical protein